VAADLRDPAAVQGLVDRAMADTGRLDVMVNNAGVMVGGPLADGDPEVWREMLEINVLALAVGSRAAVHAMRACEAEGHIVNISSSSTRNEMPGFYGASKTAVNAISASLRRELENETIRVITVTPGLTATNLGRSQPDMLRGLAALIGEEFELPADGLLPQETLAVLFAVSQPIELSVSEITVQAAKRLALA
jgi:NADP-dependent 3-hydroxy acid dehydrogenase YdfG